MALILDLCGGTGAWSAPYRAAGYAVVIVDPLADPPDTVESYLSRLQTSNARPKVHGVLAAPPCTHFSSSGARWWKQKDEQGLTVAAVATVRACLAVIALLRPAWWAMENPVGRIARLVPELGPYRMTFDPCDYGDPYTKKTCLWGRFCPPNKVPVAPTEGSKMHRLPPSKDRWRLRSATPPGFAQAFFAANP